MVRLQDHGNSAGFYETTLSVQTRQPVQSTRSFPYEQDTCILKQNTGGYRR
jgi:hypothetical protein